MNRTFETLRHKAVGGKPRLVAVVVLALFQLQSFAEQSFKTEQALDETAPYPAIELQTDSLLVRDSADADEKANATRLEEIIVFARKREEALRTIPASIAVVDGQWLEDSGAQELADFIEIIPGVSQNTLGTEQNRLTIRGIGADTARLTTSQTTATLIGETSFSDPMFSVVTPDLTPFDLAGVEILKGPQGTLFGGSGLSGALRYVPRQPQLGVWEGKLQQLYSQTKEGADSHAQAGALNIPLGQRLALRTVLMQRDAGGLIDDTARNLVDSDSRQQRSARGMLRYEVSDALSLDALYMQQRSKQDDAVFASDTNGRLIRDTTPGPSQQNSIWDLANVVVDWNFGPARLVSVTSRVTKSLDYDADFSRLVDTSPLIPYSSEEAARLVIVQRVSGNTQEFRLVSNSGAGWQWLLGVFALDYQQYFRSTLSAISGDTLTDVVLDVDNSEYALFGDAQFPVGAAFELNLGGRLYRTETSGTSRGTGPVILATTQDPENINQAGIREHGFNPKFALTWFMHEGFSSYASVSRGFRFGGIQAVQLDDAPPTYRSDRLLMYELGLRSAWLEHSLQVDAALYYIDWDEPQMVQRDSSNTFNIVDNVGSARIHGAEASLAYKLPVAGWSCALSATYTDARTTEDFESPQGEPVPSGTRLPGTSRVQTAASLQFQTRIRGQDFDFNIRHSYASQAHNDLLKHAEVMDYQSWDLQSQISFNNGVSLGLQLDNLTNQRAKSNVMYTREDVQDVYYIRPRSINVRLAYAFSS